MAPSSRFDVSKARTTQFARFDLDNAITLLQQALDLWPAPDVALDEKAGPWTVPIAAVARLGLEDADHRRQGWAKLVESVEIDGLTDSSLDVVTVELGERGVGWLEWLSCPDGRAFELEAVDDDSARLTARTRSQILERVLAILPGGRDWVVAR